MRWPWTVSRQFRPFGVRVTVEKSTMASKVPDVWTGCAALGEALAAGARLIAGAVGAWPSGPFAQPMRVSTTNPVETNRSALMAILPGADGGAVDAQDHRRPLPRAPDGRHDREEGARRGPETPS